MTGLAEKAPSLKSGQFELQTAARSYPDGEAMRRLGIITLGVMLGGAPAATMAAGRDGRPLSKNSQIRLHHTAMQVPATSPLALLVELTPAATLTVTTAADVVDPGDGKLSLREAVSAANATGVPDTIKFATALKGKTLVLTGGELEITGSLRIDGAGSEVSLSGGDISRVLNIAAGVTFKLEHLSLTNGHSSAAGDGGAIVAGSGSHLTIVDSAISHSTAKSHGGGIATGSGSTLVIRRSLITQNVVSLLSYGGGGGIAVGEGGTLVLEQSTLTSNRAINLAGEYAAADGGALFIVGGIATIDSCTIARNKAQYGGGIASGAQMVIFNSTISGNGAYDYSGGIGGGISNRGVLAVRNSTVTGNNVGGSFKYGDSYYSYGGGISSIFSDGLYIANTIVAGNTATGLIHGPDIDSITISNGHNIFGSSVTGSIPGDRVSVAASAIFATIDPKTGGGKLSPTGIVPLKNAITNPALSAADPVTAGSFGQLGTTKRPLPAGSLPDIGSIEISQPLSTSPTASNDVITGSNAANNLAGLGGNDLIQGLAGADTLNGQDGSDVLDGGPGNDKLNGGNGVDIATFAGATAVVVDLSTNPATAKRGSETDTLTSIEGAIGSDKADSFKGDGQDNEFLGGLGKDSYTGGGGRDLYAFKRVQDSPAGGGRDMIKDFVPGQDVIDVSDIDADSTVPGQQTFRWVGKATLTGAAQLGYYVSGGNTIVRASTDADGKAELEIQLTGKKTLTATSFRF